MLDMESLYRNRFSERDRQRRDEIWRVLCRRFFQRFVRPDSDTILEIACGLGEFSRHIKARRKIAFDLNPEAAKLLPEEVEFHLGSAADMSSIPDGCIDVAFSSNFLEHLASKDAVSNVLVEILRVLKEGGIYIALQPNIRFCYDRYWDFWDHHTPLSDRSCHEAFLQAGFRVVYLLPKFLPFTTKSQLPSHPFFVSLYLSIRPAWSLLGEQFLIVGEKPSHRSAQSKTAACTSISGLQ